MNEASFSHGSQQTTNSKKQPCSARACAILASKFSKYCFSWQLKRIYDNEYEEISSIQEVISE